MKGMARMKEIYTEAQIQMDHETEEMSNYDADCYIKEHFEARCDKLLKEYADAARMVR
jgi:hypothetical protein